MYICCPVSACQPWLTHPHSLIAMTFQNGTHKKLSQENEHEARLGNKQLTSNNEFC